MAEEVTKYVSSIVFDSKDAMRKLAEYEKKMDSFQRKQISMAKAGVVGRRAGGDPMIAAKTKLADQLRKEDVAQKNFNNRLELSHIKQQAAAKAASHKAADLASIKSAKDRQRYSDQNFKSSIGGLTSTSGMKASNTLFADMLRQEESAQKKVNSLKQSANRLELQNSAALEKSKDTLSRSVWFQKQYNTQTEKSIMLRLEESIASARTAKQVRDAAAIARKALNTEREKLRTFEKQNFLMKRMQASSQQMAGNMVSAFAIGAAGAGIVRTGQAFESVNNTMLAVSTNAQEAGENFQFVRDESYRLGLGLADSGKNFAKMLSARGEMSLQDTKSAFTGIAEMSTLLGLSADESTRATNALQQMMSKGVVSAEELSY